MLLIKYLEFVGVDGWGGARRMGGVWELSAASMPVPSALMHLVEARQPQESLNGPAESQLQLKHRINNGGDKVIKDQSREVDTL